MKKADFWKHIELSKRSNPEEHVERLVKRLYARRAAHIVPNPGWFKVTKKRLPSVIKSGKSTGPGWMR
jgi:hypothetical protein